MKAAARTRATLLVLFGFCLLVISGCGGSFRGSLPGRDGDGTGPNPVSGQALIAGLSPSIIAAASAPFTLTVTGVNFDRSTTVVWDFHSLPTTFVSSTTLTASIPSSLIASPGSVSVTTGPLQPISFGVSFTISPAPLDGNKAYTVSSVAIHASDMVWSAANGRLYLSASGADANYPSSLVALDPLTGQVGSSLKTATPPGELGVSDDGARLYAAFNDVFTVRSYALPGLTGPIDIPLGIGMDTAYTASDLQVQPGGAHTVAIARTAVGNAYQNQGDIAVFDDAIARAQTAVSGTTVPFSRLAWSADGQTIVGTAESLQSLDVFSVDSTGVVLKSKVPIASGLRDRFTLSAAGNLLYLDNGGIIDASTGAGLGGLPTGAIPPGLTNQQAAFDDKLKIGYLAGKLAGGSFVDTYVIEAFDLADLHLLGTATLPNVTGSPVKLLRWGDQGLALLTADSSVYGSGGVFVLNGAFVTHPGSQ